ncbi:MAG TPA: hypothetical protein VD788_13835, partial [Candidatus Polarisedimenticolaceae bacterium]|nr:hypothetical protein [Candidatus Polarisedimenticolaceae bacterium]
MIPFPGALVAVWEAGELTLGVVAGEEKRRLRLVLEGGREIRVQPARIAWEVEAPGKVPGAAPEERREAGERVERAERRLRGVADSIDVELVWQILAEAGAPPADGFETGDLAELALDSRSGESMAATVRALRRDGLRFTRKGERWLARAAEQVADLERERERIAERELQTRALFDALAAAVRGQAFHETGSEYERRYLDALTRLAVDAESAPEVARALAVEALSASGLRCERPHEGAFRLLRLVGRLEHDDVNL